MSLPSADLNQPLRIDSVRLGNGAVLGMSHCPGRRGADDQGRLWQRDLDQDLCAIVAWGASTVLSLIDSSEFVRLGVDDFGAAIARTPMTWLQWPIADMKTPGPATCLAWQQSGPVLLDAIDRGDRVLVHCAAGLGRTGMMVASLMAGQGVSADESIRLVRAARPGTIETEAQAQWVRGRGLG